MVGRDVTEARRAERALRESESRLRAMIDQVAVGVVQAEAATGRFLHVNARFCEMLGYSPDQLKARAWADVTHPGDVGDDRAGVARLMATGEPHRREKRYLRADGSVLWASLTVNRVALPGIRLHPGRHLRARGARLSGPAPG